MKILALLRGYSHFDLNILILKVGAWVNILCETEPEILSFKVFCRAVIGCIFGRIDKDHDSFCN